MELGTIDSVKMFTKKGKGSKYFRSALIKMSEWKYSENATMIKTAIQEEGGWAQIPYGELMREANNGYWKCYIGKEYTKKKVTISVGKDTAITKSAKVVTKTSDEIAEDAAKEETPDVDGSSVTRRVNFSVGEDEIDRLGRVGRSSSDRSLCASFVLCARG